MDYAEANDFVIVSDGVVQGTWGPVDNRHSEWVLLRLRREIIGLHSDEAQARLAQLLMQRHCSGNDSIAISSCELAIWDLRGKRNGVPTFNLIGDRVRDKVSCYSSALAFDILDPSARDRAFEAAGPCTWGVKWAARTEAWRCSDGIHELVTELAAIQPRTRVMLDALCKWSEEFTLEFIEASSDIRLEWLEEPFSPRALASYRRLASPTTYPIAAGEHIYCLDDAINLHDVGVRVLQPDPRWCGGLSMLMQIVEFSYKRQVPVFPHGGGLVPALHAAVLWPETIIPALEYHLTVEPKRQRYWRYKFQPSNGALDAPKLPGLGIEINEDLVDHSREFRSCRWESM